MRFFLNDVNGWKVRAVPNKYPALSPEGERVRKIQGTFRSLSGVGYHEVIIEHPRHDLTTALMDVADVVDIIKVYQQRYSEIRKDLGILCGTEVVVVVVVSGVEVVAVVRLVVGAAS